MNEVALVRPYFELDREFHKKLPDVTVLICQRKTKDLTQLTIESLLRFYPDINILVIDGDSRDDSTLYLRWKAVTVPNLKLVELRVSDKQKHNSHGETMDEAIRNHIKTKYVLLLDSDVITHRGGFIEGMREQIEKEGLYATGTLMIVSEKGEACKPPESEEDVLRYAHPSCSLYDAEKYRTLKEFTDHGAPCALNMIDAKKKGLGIGYFPVDKYANHLSGGSWCEPATIWKHDFGVYLRPFVTFIGNNVNMQTDLDFDIVPYVHTPKKHFVILHEDLIKREIENILYDIRFKVHGEYVCDLQTEFIVNDFVTQVKQEAIRNNAPDTLEVDGHVVYRRNYWQNKICLE